MDRDAQSVWGDAPAKVAHYRFFASRRLYLRRCASVLGVRNFPFYNENIGLIKRTNITESVNVEWRVEFFNILNRVRFGSPTIDVSSPTFGLIGGSGNSPRQGQMALKINF